MKCSDIMNRQHQRFVEMRTSAIPEPNKETLAAWRFGDLKHDIIMNLLLEEESK